MVNVKIGNVRKNLKEENRQNIFDIIYKLNREVTTREIKECLDRKIQEDNDNVKKEIVEKYENGLITKSEKDREIKDSVKSGFNIRTIQRHIKEDYRISESGGKCYIPEVFRSESRYTDPKEFGRSVFNEIMGEMNEIPEKDRDDSYYKRELNDFIIKTGFFIALTMIEASKPFKDKSLSIREREDYVYYWLKNIIPIDFIFSVFRFKFDYPKHLHNWQTPFSEIEEEILEKVLKNIKETYPDIMTTYKNKVRTIRGK